MLRRTDTVLAAAACFDLVDLETVKDELAVPQGDYLPDAQYKRYIAQVSAAVHGQIDPRVLPVQSYRNTYRWDAGWFGQRDWYRQRYEIELSLSQYPVQSISSVTENGIALDASDYELDADAGLIRRLSGGAYTPWRASEIIIEFEAGYSTIPADIVGIVLRLITMRAKGRNRDPMLREREGPTYGRESFWVGGTPDMRGGMPLEMAQVLDRYRPVLIG